MPDSYLHSISNNSDRLAYRRKLPFNKAKFLQDAGRWILGRHRIGSKRGASECASHKKFITAAEGASTQQAKTGLAGGSGLRSIGFLFGCGSATCAICGRKLFSRELPEAAWANDIFSGFFDSPSVALLLRSRSGWTGVESDLYGHEWPLFHPA